jgi:hypothetical protein
MAEHLVTSFSPEKIGDLVASEFKNGEPYVHLKELSFAKSAKATRAKQTLAICERVGTLIQTNVEPLSAIERLDGRSEPNPKKDFFHTSGFSNLSPEKFISYWNGQPLEAGDTIDILPINRVIEHMRELSEEKEPLMKDMLERIEEDCEGDVRRPIFDPSTGSVRFDKEIMSIDDLGRVELFFKLIQEEQRKLDEQTQRKHAGDEEEHLLTSSIELGGGDAIFFDNEKVLHRRTPARVDRRLTFRVLLHTLIDPTRMDMDAMTHIKLYL